MFTRMHIVGIFIHDLNKLKHLVAPPIPYEILCRNSNRVPVFEGIYMKNCDIQPISLKRYTIGLQLLRNANRNSHAIYNIVRISSAKLWRGPHLWGAECRWGTKNCDLWRPFDFCIEPHRRGFPYSLHQTVLESWGAILKSSDLGLRFS